MSSEIAEQLAGLESVVQELNLPNISPDRKDMIERELQNFKDQPQSWYLACSFMGMSSDSLVLFYSATVLENTVHNKWSVIDADERQHVKTFLTEFLQDNFSQLKHFVRNKVLQVFVVIGRTEWREYFPQFLDIVKGWCGNPNTVLLGLTALKMISEDCSDHRASRLADTFLHRVSCVCV